MIDPEFKAFLAGFTASFGVELVALLRSYQRGRNYVAVRYRDWLFWLPRMVLAVVAGIVAWLFYVPGMSAAASLYIGAATPLILAQLSTGSLKAGD